MKRCFLFLLSFCFFCLSYAQEDVAAAQKQINDIKADAGTYLYAEATSAKWEESYDNAKALLEANIEDWARNENSQADLTGCIAKAENSIFEIKSRRGKLYRTFLYVKKSDILTFSTDKELVIVPLNQREDKGSETVQIATAEMQPQTRSVFQLSSAEKEMLEVTEFSDIESFIKGNSKVAKYGKYVSIPETGDCYLFVYDRNGKISAYLKRADSKYMNMKTGEPDKIENYKGCGALWFMYK